MAGYQSENERNTRAYTLYIPSYSRSSEIRILSKNLIDFCIDWRVLKSGFSWIIFCIFEVPLKIGISRKYDRSKDKSILISMGRLYIQDSLFVYSHGNLNTHSHTHTWICLLLTLLTLLKLTVFLHMCFCAHKCLFLSTN